MQHTLIGQGQKGSPAQETKTGRQDPDESCRTFVQKFYDWYAPVVNQSSQSASDIAIKYKTSAFNPELVRALKEDSEAQAKVVGEVVGIDFDPFLFAQDPCEHYLVGSITRKEDNYWVQVYGVCSGKKHPKPDVVAELTIKDGQWRFLNFHYGKGNQSQDENLLSILKRFRDERQRSSK